MYGSNNTIENLKKKWARICLAVGPDTNEGQFIFCRFFSIKLSLGGLDSSRNSQSAWLSSLKVSAEGLGRWLDGGKPPCRPQPRPSPPAIRSQH